MNAIMVPERQSLDFLTGGEGPYVNVHATTVEHFTRQLDLGPESLGRYFDKAETLYFDKTLVDADLLRRFDVVTEPHGLIRGWYVTQDEFEKNSASLRSLTAHWEPLRPHLGMVKTWENPDLGSCKALLHAEFQQRWLPVSPEGIKVYTYYGDFEDGRAVYFLFQGGSLYQVDRFEVKTDPQYSSLVLEKLPNDRYLEVYLRAVRPPPKPSA